MAVNKGKPMRQPRFNFMWFWALVVVVIIGYSMFGSTEQRPIQGNWNMVEELVERGLVERIEVLDKEKASVYLVENAREQLVDDSRFTTLPATGVQIIYNTGGDVQYFAERIERAEEAAKEQNPDAKSVVVEYGRSERGFMSYLLDALPFILLIVFFFVIMRRSAGGGAGGGIMNVGKARAQMSDKNSKERVTFKDVAGLEEAKKVAPCIVFIDEIDAIGRARGKNSGFSGNDERENTLNQLLTEMDGFQTNAGVIVLAATNRVDILDKALMRAGRFDRQIEVGLPDVKERKEIFDVHLRKLKLDDKLDREFLAKQTPGFAGADIANVCNEAALIAARHDKKAITQEDFLAAIDRIVGGLERRNMPMTAQERRSTAIHEAGHATVMWRLQHCDPVLKITIIPRGRSLGATWYLPEERVNHNVEHFMHKLAGLVAGRVAEQVLLDVTSTGALNDLERTSKTAYAMVAYYGMSPKVGNVSYYDATGTHDMFTKPFSERTAECIDEEVRRIVDEAVALAREIIIAERERIEALADVLLKKETIFTEDIEEIMGKSAQQLAKEEQTANIAEAEVVE